MLHQIQFAVLNALTSKKGAAMAEYGLLVALIAVAAITATTSVGTNIVAKFTSIANAL